MRLLLALLLLPILLSAQTIPADGRVHTYSTFTEVQASHIYQVTITQGLEYTVQLEATEEIKPYLEAEVDRGQLSLRMDQRMNFMDNRKIGRNAKVIVRVTMPILKELEVSGAANVSVEEFEQPDQDMKIDLSGAGHLDISGSCRNLELELSGAGQLTGANFTAAKCEVDGSGAGQAKMRVTEAIAGKMSGAASLRYTGNPANRDVRTSGAGSISGH